MTIRKATEIEAKFHVPMELRAAPPSPEEQREWDFGLTAEDEDGQRYFCRKTPANVFEDVKGQRIYTDFKQMFHTKTEALTGKNAATGSRLALVSVHPDGPERDKVRYIVDPFRDVDFGDFAATGIIGDWEKEWARGGEPV